MKLKVATGIFLLFSISSIQASTVEQAESLLEQGRAEQALQSAITQLEENPADANWLFLKARSLAALDKLEQAEKLYRQVIAQQPKQAEAYNNLAAILMRQNRLNEASQLLERALSHIDPVYATLYQNLQTVNVEIARESYGKALRVEVPQQKVTLKSLPLSGSESEPVQLAKMPLSGQQNEAPEQTQAEQALVKTVLPKLPVVHIEPDRQVIKNTVEGWATAWSAQDVDLYLSFYASSFAPPHGMSRQDWEAQRRYRLTQPQWIRVNLEQLEITRQSAQQVVVEFTQEYRSDTYADKTQKQLVLSQDAEGWRIQEENSL